MCISRFWLSSLELECFPLIRGDIKDGKIMSFSSVDLFGTAKSDDVVVEKRGGVEISGFVIKMIDLDPAWLLIGFGVWRKGKEGK